MHKNDLCVQDYLHLAIPQRLRSSLAKLRIGNHDLEIERGRHHRIPVNERICKLCHSLNELHVEDEYHVVMQCPFYDDLRNIYLDIQDKPKNLYTFISVMKAQDDKLINLASYAACMFKQRRNLLSQIV